MGEMKGSMDGRWRKGWKLDVFWKVGSDYHVNWVGSVEPFVSGRMFIYIGNALKYKKRSRDRSQIGSVRYKRLTRRGKKGDRDRLQFE